MNICKYDKTVLTFLTLSLLASIVIWYLTTSITFLWIVTIAILLAITKKYNYSYSRLPIFLLVFFISLFGDTNYILYFAIVDFLISLLLLFFHKGVFRLSIKTVIPWIIMLIVGVISGLFNATDVSSSNLGIEIYLLLAIMLISSDINRSYGVINPLFISYYTIIINLSLIVLFWINNYANVFSISRGELQLLGDSGIRSNTLSGFITVFFIFTLFSVINSRKAIVIKVVILLGDIITLLFLQSRGSYIAIAAVIVLTEIKYLKDAEKINNSRLTLDLSLLISILFLFIYPQTRAFLNKYLFSRFVGVNDISNGRFELYAQSVEMWKKHPIIGNGFLQFYNNNIATGDPHNFILGYLASVGVVGTLFFIIFLASLFFYKSSSSSVILAIKYTLVAQIVHGCFEPVLTTSFPLSLFIIFSSYLLSIKTDSKSSIIEERSDSLLFKNSYSFF